MTSYILDNDGMPIAITPTLSEKSGPCRYAFEVCRERIDANRELNLVNARAGKISNAKKWQTWEAKNNTTLPFAAEVAPREYFVSVLMIGDV